MVELSRLNGNDFNYLMRASEALLGEVDKTLIAGAPNLSKYEQRSRLDDSAHLTNQLIDLYNKGYTLEQIDKLIGKKDGLTTKKQSSWSKLTDSVCKFVERTSPKYIIDLEQGVNRAALEDFNYLRNIRGAYLPALLKTLAKGWYYFPRPPSIEKSTEYQRKLMSGEPIETHVGIQEAHELGVETGKITLKDPGLAVTKSGQKITDIKTLKYLFPELYMSFAGGEAPTHYSVDHTIKKILGDYGLERVGYEIHPSSVDFDKRLPKKVEKELERELGGDFFINLPASRWVKAAAIGGALLAIFGSVYTLTPDTDHTKQKIKAGASSILGGIPYAGEYFKDTDGDGIVDAKDQRPTIHDFPATAYAEEKGLPPDVVEKLTPLNSGPDGVPQLDTCEKSFIDLLSGLDYTQQIELVKLASDGKIIDLDVDFANQLYNLGDLNLQNQLSQLARDGKITERDLAFLDYLNSLGNLDLAKKITSAFSTYISTGDISEEVIDQLAFLDSLPVDIRQELIESGKAANSDWDGDGFSNYFESKHRLYDWKIPNNSYFILLEALDINYLRSDGISYGERIGYSDLAKLLEENFPKENIIRLEYKEVTPTNIENAINDIISKADENDFVYLFLNSHGNVGIFRAYNDQTGINQPFQYTDLDLLLDKINAKAVVAAIDACYCGSAIEPMKDGPVPRIVMTETNADQKGGDMVLADNFRKSFTDKTADSDGDKYVSVREGFWYARTALRETQKVAHYGTTGEWPLESELRDSKISDPFKLSSEIYLVDVKV